MQVGCTINYGRSCLWKQTEESACVDYPCNVGENDSATTRGPNYLVGLRFFCFNRGPVAQLGARFHGMEEVVGSIPTRSTKALNPLDGAGGFSDGVCVAVCVVTPRSGAHSKGFHRVALGFHTHVAVPL